MELGKLAYNYQSHHMSIIRNFVKSKYHYRHRNRPNDPSYHFSTCCFHDADHNMMTLSFKPLILTMIRKGGMLHKGISKHNTRHAKYFFFYVEV